MRPGCDLAARRPFPKWETGRPVTVEGIFLPTPETQSFVPTSTDVAEGRNFFEQHFSVLWTSRAVFLSKFGVRTLFATIFLKAFLGHCTITETIRRNGLHSD